MMLSQNIGQRLLLISATLAAVCISTLPTAVDSYYQYAQPLMAPGKPIECPDKQLSCQDTETCCKLKDEGYGCCPAANATCCPDGEHCCPSGTVCDDKKGRCNRRTKLPGFIRYRSVPTKLDAEVLIKTTNSLEGADLNSDWGLSQNSKCTEGGYYCPDIYTCCPAKDGKWACCPLHKAECCANSDYCCPGGTTCNLEKNTCERNTTYQTTFVAAPMTIRKKIFEEKEKEVTAPSVICPDKEYTCPSETTCCKLPSEGYGCCPMPNATCCSDGLHCCPSGTTCDLEKQMCNQDKVPYSTIISSLIPTKPKPKKEEVSIVCPDKEFTCPTGTTCCKLQSKGFGCCPFPNATCCSDGLHCCPSGTTCDLERQTCNQDNVAFPIFANFPQRTEVKTVDIEEAESSKDDESASSSSSTEEGQRDCLGFANDAVCGDGSCCPEGKVCCPTGPGTWGCCLIEDIIIDLV